MTQDSSTGNPTDSITQDNRMMSIMADLCILVDKAHRGALGKYGSVRVTNFFGHVFRPGWMKRSKTTNHHGA
jgi:hypothetical protein